MRVLNLFDLPENSHSLYWSTYQVNEERKRWVRNEPDVTGEKRIRAQNYAIC